MRKGFTLIDVAFLILLLGALLLGFSKLIPSVVKENQVNKTKELIDSKVDSITSFSQNHKTLPTTTLFNTLGASNKDTWNQTINYIHDASLESNQFICNKNTTSLSIQICTEPLTCTPSKTISNIAFIVYSNGYNQISQSSLESNVFNIYPSDAEINGATYDDVVSWLTLDDIRQLTYCKREKLRLLNSDLVKVKPSKFFVLKVYPEGGVPFLNDLYLWDYSIVSTDPFTTSCSDNLDIDSKAQYLHIDCGIKPKNNNEYLFTINVSDDDGNSYTRINTQSTEEVLPTIYITAQVDIYYNKGSGCTQALATSNIEFYDGESITFYQEDNCTGKSISKAYNQVSSIDANDDNVVVVTKGSSKPEINDN